jgi:16S rRNA (adenine1518-N6/adenine1519-N6)-dimethyltransferase
VSLPELDFSQLPPLRDIIVAHDLRAHKALGQNFLLDQNITDKIAKSCGDLSSLTVFEIGPGPGGLTRSLLKAGAKKVIAVEFDERAVRALQDLKNFSQGRLEIIQGDALNIDLTTLTDGPKAIVANLPYNIATPLLVNWLRQIREDNAYAFMALMFQKEVGERIAAGPGSKIYGRLSVLAQWLCTVKKLFDLPPSVFVPPPKVTSSVVHFAPKPLGLNAPSFGAIETLTAAAFGQRRKMIRSTLKDYAIRLEQLGIDPTKRAEELIVEEFVDIARYSIV